MPYIGHLFYGFCILIPILYFTKNDNSFNYKVAFIFFANTLFGPDLVIMFALMEFHSLIGFAILAIPLSLFYSYFSRFSLNKSGKKFFPLKLEDDGVKEVNWKNSYCITVAGGFCHLMIDHLFYADLSMTFWPGITISQMDLLTFWGTDVFYINPLYFVANVIIVAIILVSLFCFKKGYKSVSQLFLIAIGLTAGLVLFTQVTIGSQKELGVLFFCVVYFLIPFFLLMYAARDVQDNPNETSKEPKINKKTQLNIVIILSILMALFLILYALFIIQSAETLAKLYASLFGSDVKEVTDSLVIIGYISLVIDVVLLIGLIGLFFKSNICRNIVIAICSYYFIVAFPFAIALFLCEKDVKAMFRGEPEKSL